MGIRSQLRHLHRRFQPLEPRRLPCRLATTQRSPRWSNAGKIPTEPFYENGKQVKRPLGIYSDDLYTSKLLDYLEEGRESGKPFFAYVAYTTAHAPLQAPDFLIDKYYDHYFELGYEGLKRARFDSQKAHGILPEGRAIR